MKGSLRFWFVLFASLARPALLPASGLGSGFFISSGAEGGYYHGVGGRLALVMLREGIEAVNVPSQGSLQNLAKLVDEKDPANVALVQSDALHWYLKERPESVERLLVVDDVGKECVALITRKDGNVASASDLKAGRGLKLAVRSPESGSALTFASMKKVDAGYADTQLAFQKPVEALLRMRLEPEFSQVAGVMLVERPRSHSPAMEIALAHPDVYRFTAVRKDDFANPSPEVLGISKRPVYTFETVSSGFGRDRRVTYDTVCTRALLVISVAKLSDAQRDQILATMRAHGPFVAPGRER